MGVRFFDRFLTWAGYLPALLIILISFIWYTFFSVPDELFPLSYSRVINDREGILLSAGIARDGQWRFPGKESLPEKFAAALITYEDKRFYSHNGIDLLALARAVRLNITRRKIVSGASTLTMQVIRLHRDGRPRSYSEKFLEMLLAWRLTIDFDKARILRLFASHAPFGGNVVGLEAASWRYFGRPPDNLGWADAAMLAVLPNSPGLIHPGRNRDELLEKRNSLLYRLHEKEYFDRSDLILAMAEPVPPAPYPLPRHAPHLLERLGTIEGNLSNSSGKGVLTTTIDGDLQRHVNRIAEKYWEILDSRGIGNLGVLVLDTRTGETAAYVGNGPLERAPNSYVDMVTAPRSTGSLLKPFLYGGMIDSGEILPRQLVLDIPTRMGTYMPENPTRIYLGAVPADVALAQSLNVPAARLLKEFGIHRFFGLLEEIGMNTLVRSADGYGVSLVLGGAEGSLENLTGMYSGLGRMVLNDSGKAAFFDPVYLPGRVGASIHDSPIHPGSSRLVLKAMEELVRPREESGWRNFLSAGTVSWKTGTSYGFRDAWAIGVTPGYTVGIWVGNSTGEGKAGIQGTLTAAPLLFQILEFLDTGGEFFGPSGMEKITVCRKSGFLAGPDCPETEEVLMPPVPNPGEVCPYHILVHLNPGRSHRVSTDDISAGLIRQESWFVLPPVAEWYYSRWNMDYRPLPPRMNRTEEPEGTPMELPFPGENDELYLPVDLGGEPGQAVFEIFHRDTERTVFWHLDEDYLGQTSGIHQWETRPTHGPHTLTVIDDQGAVLIRRFNVLSN